MKTMARFVGIALLALVIGGCAERQPESIARASFAADAAPSPEQAILRRASIEVLVADLTGAGAEAERLTTAKGGMVQSSSREGADRSSFELRVPSEHLDRLLDELGGLGKVQRRHVSSEDVTSQIRDLDNELTNKRALRDRLRALLERANEVKDVLSVEVELTRLQTEIDSLDGRLKMLRHDVAMSAVSLSLTRERHVVLGPLGYVWKGTVWVIEKLFIIDHDRGDDLAN